MNKNLTCLAEGYVFPTCQDETGINPNEIIVGPTRSGKTMSVVEPKLLHTFDSSMVVSVTKRALVKKYKKIFQERGYKVWDLNFADPLKSTVTYDPMDFVNTDQDIIRLASMFVGMEASRSHDGTSDPYWNQSAISGLAAIIGLAVSRASDQGRKATFNDFYSLYTSLTISGESRVTTSLDRYFDDNEIRHPGSQCTRLWKTIRGNAPRTSSCIYSVMNNAVDKLMTPDALKLMSGRRRVDFEKLSNEKTIMFITTSPVNKAMQQLSTLFYSDAFRMLFEYAESLPNGELPVPVHLICDDFATGSIIPDFDEYISVLCAKRISVTLLLQSESQLEAMYGKNAATTIINNCDTYLYMGGMDDTTCYNISRRRNIPIEDVYSMPLEQVMLFRRGARPVTAHRYKTLEDPLYKELNEEH